MTILLLLGLLAVFGIYLFFAALWLTLKIVFWFIGGLFGLAGAGVALLIAGAVGLLLLPLLGVMLLPLFLPIIAALGLIWLLSRNRSPQPIPAVVRH
jgi:hypothetical protein